jgi:NTE family protein
VLAEGSAADAIIASTAIPGAFSPIHYKNFYLADGAISSNTPVKIAVQKGATRLIIQPTGHACANQAPPAGAVANAPARTDAVDRAAIGQRPCEPRYGG